MMHRLLYISTARTMPDAAMVASILERSRINNAAVEVTGMLVVGGRRFLQTLERPTDAVHTVFRRIAADSRHFAIVELASEAIETRTFGGWAMGYRPGATAIGCAMWWRR
ncbi:BLUF domain-containing protein [uncultured Sphingomonas sp.]|uniref:BLUF domain-containing protein n=1 Tax=uncultured Sphingomonas sp. TaxID=158754 RepID=UPI0035CA9CBB